MEGGSHGYNPSLTFPMSRTMTANIPGARLRDVERRLALLKGEEAINSFLAEHPNEVKVLEQMVEQRRAGKPVPALTRVQRVMLWSDGSLEYKLEAAPDGREGPGERGARGERGGRGARPAWSGPPVGGTSGPPAMGGRGPQGGRGGAGTSRPGGQGGPGGPPRGGRGGGPRGRGRPFGDDRGERGLPRSGEGWVLLREGEKPPEPEPLPEYEWDEEEAPRESEAPAPRAAGEETTTE